MCVAGLIADGGALVLSGRLVATKAAFYDAGATIDVTLRVPTEVIARGVCVEAVPLHTAFGATTQTKCVTTGVSVPITVNLPAVYSISLRFDTANSASKSDHLWMQRAVVIAVVTGNLSMADSIIGVIFCTLCVVGLFVFVLIPVVFRLKYAPNPATQ